MIPIKQSSGCGACEPLARVPTCLSSRQAVCNTPQLIGEPALLDSLVQALEADWSALATSPMRFNSLACSLQVGQGEACLALNVSAHCGGLMLADSAFHTLRRCLPDTDIYVNPAPAG